VQILNRSDKVSFVLLRKRIVSYGGVKMKGFRGESDGRDQTNIARLWGDELPEARRFISLWEARDGKGVQDGTWKSGIFRP